MTGNLSPPNEGVAQPADDELMDGFYIEEGNLYFLDHGKDGEPIEVCVGPEIHLGNIYEDFSTKHLTYEIMFMYRGELRTILVPRNQFTASKLQSQHTNTGSPFLNSKDNALYIEFLKRFEDEVERITTCDRAGWITTDQGHRLYVHAQTYGLNGVNRMFQYSGGMVLSSKGTAMEAIAVYNDLIASRPPLQLALTFGLSAVVTVPLRLTNQFIHAYGDSTMGKTTMLILAAAPFGYPCVNDGENDGVIDTWNCTDNSFMKTLTGNSGVLAAFDEVSAANFLDEQFTYRIYGGRDKKRMGDKANGNKSWLTVILSTGESAISSRSNQNNGSRIRLLEYFNVPWTQSKEESETVERVICEQYGTLAPAFAQEIMRMGDEIHSIYEECRKEVSGLLDPNNRLAQRMAKNIAGLYFTARISSERLGLAIDSTAVLNLLLQSETLINTQRSYSERVIDIIKSTLATKWHLFGIDGDIYDVRAGSPKGGIGKIVVRNCRRDGYEIKRVIIEYGEYEKILKANGFEDATVIGRELYEKGLIKCEKSGKYIKYYNRASLNGQPAVKVMDFYGVSFNAPPEPEANRKLCYYTCNL